MCLSVCLSVVHSDMSCKTVEQIEMTCSKEGAWIGEGMKETCKKEICSEFHRDRYIMSPLCGENLSLCHYFDEKLSFGVSEPRAQQFADHDIIFFTRQIVGMLASSLVASRLAVCVVCYSSVAYVWTRCKFSR